MEYSVKYGLGDVLSIENWNHDEVFTGIVKSIFIREDDACETCINYEVRSFNNDLFIDERGDEKFNILGCVGNIHVLKER